MAYLVTCGSYEKMSDPHSDTPGLAGWTEPSLLPCSLTRPILSHLSDSEQLWAAESCSWDSRPEPSPEHLPTHSAVHEGAKDADSDPLT